MTLPHIHRVDATYTFAHQTYIKALNSENGDYFGFAVAISADGNNLVVGALSEASAFRGVSTSPVVPEDNSALYAGAVYVFGRASNSDAFTSSSYVKAPNTRAGDWFGETVAISANGDTLVVGAHLEDSAATGIGGNQQNDCENKDGLANPSPKNCAVSSGAVYFY